MEFGEAILDHTGRMSWGETLGKELKGGSDVRR
jgi:hypothetical protein